jgi:N-acetylglutamate synthase-like GNAT family acetyltransferase
MKFFNLKDKPEYIPIVAKWFHEEWSHLNPSRSLEDVIDLIHKIFQSEADEIFICTSKQEVVSSITLRAYELEHESEYSPWLSSLVVDKTKRRNGIGKKTINFFIEYCQSHDISKVYLFTENLNEWYAKLGWNTIKETSFKSHTGEIMGLAI